MREDWLKPFIREILAGAERLFLVCAQGKIAQGNSTDYETQVFGDARFSRSRTSLRAARTNECFGETQHENAIGTQQNQRSSMNTSVSSSPQPSLVPIRGYSEEMNQAGIFVWFQIHIHWKR